MLLKGVIQSLNNLANEQSEDQEAPELNRRGFFKVAAAAAVATGGLAIEPAMAKSSRERCLSIYCPNTTETIRVVYWTPADGYIQESIAELSYTMRDRHNNLVKKIDRNLLDQMFLLQTKLRPRQPMHVLCGYRSPQTNARMRRQKRGVAKESYHIKGMAADIRMPDRNYSDLHRAAVSLKTGGVGRYGRSRFVHIDSGPVRTWGR